jgi:hypothetical protein
MDSRVHSPSLFWDQLARPLSSCDHDQQLPLTALGLASAYVYIHIHLKEHPKDGLKG